MSDLWSFVGGRQRKDHNDRFYESVLRAQAKRDARDVARAEAAKAQSAPPAAPTRLICRAPKLRELKRTGRNLQNLTGKRFGQLTVLNIAARKAGRGQYVYNVRCDCGTEKMIAAKILRAGGAVSCGCYKRTQSIQRVKTQVRDGDGRFLCEASP